MSLPRTGRRLAKRLIPLAETVVGLVTITSTPGATDFDPPTLTPATVEVDAVVTGVSKWETSSTVVSSDRKVLVEGGLPALGVGGVIRIDGRNNTIVDKTEILEGGYPSAIKYFVRQG